MSRRDKRGAGRAAAPTPRGAATAPHPGAIQAPDQRWVIGGRATIYPAEPGWRAILVAHDDEGKPLESIPGHVAVVATEVVTWALFLIVVQPLPGEHPAQFKPSTTILRPLDGKGREIDGAKGYLGLSYPGEADDVAIARLTGSMPMQPG